MTTEGVWVAQRSDPVVQFFPQPDGHLRPRGQQGQYTQLCLYHSAMYIHLRGGVLFILIGSRLSQPAAGWQAACEEMGRE